MVEQRELLPVIQDDREAAADFDNDRLCYSTPYQEGLRGGQHDASLIVQSFAAHRLRHSTDFERGLEAGAALAEKWRDENRAAAVKERNRAIFDSGVGMADQLDGAAIECNAIAQAIRALIPPAKP